MNDHEIRRQLHDLAERYGDADELRAEVRQRLEALDGAPGITLASNRRGPDAGSRLLAVAAAMVLVVVVSVAGLYALGGGSDSDRLAVDPTDDPIPAASAAIASPPETIAVIRGDRQTYVTTLTDPTVEFEVPVGADLAVELTSESDQLVEFRIDSPDVSDGHLAIVVPPVADAGSFEEVLEWLRSSLSQAELVDVSEVVIDGRSAQRARLASAVDMTLTGFRFGPRTFVSASGIDRSYEAYLVSRPDGGVLIVWVDAARAEIDAARSFAAVVVADLDWPT